MAAVSPIKVDAATDKMIADAAHVLGRSKKDFVDDTVRAYIDVNRDEVNAGVKAAMTRLDGSRAAIVSEITGLSREQLDDLGGVPEQ